MTSTPIKKAPLGFGLGLRTQHYESLLEGEHAVDWLEIISENYMIGGGKPLYFLEKLRERFPMVMHGVSLSIGGTDPLNMTYLKELKQLINRVNPAWISDHLCWTGVHGVQLHDLMPLPYTQKTIAHVAERIAQVQDFLGQRILIENVSSYLTYPISEMSEWDFVNAIAEKADCLLLLDVNNIYVSAVNHGFDAKKYIDALPAHRIQQIHLAGHIREGDVIIDTHDHPVVSDVWDLYAYSIQRFGHVSTMIERDADIPPIEELILELNQAREISREQIKINTQTIYNKETELSL